MVPLDQLAWHYMMIPARTDDSPTEQRRRNNTIY
jgi:hypothetical protein